MGVSVLQVVVVLFALFAWSRALLRLRDKKISIGEFVFWSVLWAGVIITSLSPQTADAFSAFFGIERPIDLAVYLSIILIFYLVFRLYVRSEQQQQEITGLVRALALQQPKKKEK